jgi:cell division septation protein DedD
VTDLSHDGTDDGFHEIQLSGKQLVFLFMATTVVSVVIFLCGVLVGRGVRGEALSAGSTPTVASAGPGVSTANPPAPPPQSVDAPAPAEPLSYPQRLDGEKPPVDTLKSRAQQEPTPAPVDPKPAAGQQTVAKVDPPKPAPATVAPSPQSNGSAQPGIWAVQVVALTDHAAASAVVRRLSSKGYPAFLVTPQSGSAVQNYKVQVGRFDDRSQAEQIAGRLKKEEQFQPWILR